MLFSGTFAKMWSTVESARISDQTAKVDSQYLSIHMHAHSHTQRIKQCIYKTSSIHRTQKFFTIFTKTLFLNLILSYIHTLTLHYSILLLTSHLHLGQPSDLYGERPPWESNICSGSQDSPASHNGIWNFIVIFTTSNQQKISKARLILSISHKLCNICSE